MRVIIKPMGFVLILVSFVVLAALIFIPLAKTAKPLTGGKTWALSLSNVANDPDGWGVSQLTPDSATARINTLTDGPAGNEKSAKITVAKADKEQSWYVQSIYTLKEPLAQGQPLTLRFWARSSDSKTIVVVFEQNYEPYEKDLAQRVPLTPEWKQYSYSFITTRAYDSGKSKLGFQIGETTGDFEFTGVELTAP
jgi:hypothetical protein